MVNSWEMEETHFECTESTVLVKCELIFYPAPGTLILFVETHDEHCVKGVNYCITDPSCACEIGTLMANWVVFICTHGILFFGERSGVSSHIEEGGIVP